MIEHKKFKIVGCPKCQRIQTIESNIILKCKLCGKTTRMVDKKKDEWAVKIYSSYDNPTEASHVCTVLKGKVESDGKLHYKGDEDWVRK